MTEKEPLPQLVEVLLHVAARAATFSIVQPHGLLLDVINGLSGSMMFQSYAAHTGYFLIIPLTQAILLPFNLMQSRRLLLQTAVTWGYIFQSYAVTQTASAITYNDYIFYIM